MFRLVPIDNNIPSHSYPDEVPGHIVQAVKRSETVSPDYTTKKFSPINVICAIARITPHHHTRCCLFVVILFQYDP